MIGIIKEHNLSVKVGQKFCVPGVEYELLEIHMRTILSWNSRCQFSNAVCAII